MLRQLRSASSHKFFRPFGHIALAICFLTFVGVYFGAHDVLFLAPMITLITVLNIWANKSCAACGATNRNPFLFPLPRFCGKCGAKL